jgi:phospholipase A1
MLLSLSTLLLSAPALSQHETEYFYTEDITNIETKKAMNDWLSSNFGLKPHKTNYLLPFGVREGHYDQYVASDEYRNIEAELQVSLKLNVTNNVFGLNESYNLSYTHTSFWQIYSPSSPFRETNYNPEFFVVFPIEDRSLMRLKSVTTGLAHLSNGQGNIQDSSIPTELSSIPAVQPYLRNRSRSVNYLYAKADMQYDNFIVDVTAWIPYFGSDLSDNPDLVDYTGLTKLGVKYFYGKNLITLDTNLNFFTGRGSVTATYSYPIYDGAFFYTKLFSGYNESLIDYNNNLTKLSIGFSFSR